MPVTYDTLPFAVPDGQNVLPVPIARVRQQRSSFLHVSSVAVLGLVPMLSLTGCGRRATPQDCQLIVDRSVELRLKGDSESDPQIIAKREVAVRAELDDKIKSCESRRVTDRMMACVRTATRSEELEECLR